MNRRKNIFLPLHFVSAGKQPFFKKCRQILHPTLQNKCFSSRPHFVWAAFCRCSRCSRRLNCFRPSDCASRPRSWRDGAAPGCCCCPTAMSASVRRTKRSCSTVPPPFRHLNKNFFLNPPPQQKYFFYFLVFLQNYFCFKMYIFYKKKSMKNFMFIRPKNEANINHFKQEILCQNCIF